MNIEEKVDKALKNGFYGTLWGEPKEKAKEINFINPTRDVERSRYEEKPCIVLWLGSMSYSDYIVYLYEDYGKTWALTKEELL